MEVETTGVIYDRSVLPDGTDLQNGRYKICTTLGKGGFGTTYKAWDYSLERFVAIKEFFPDGFAYLSEPGGAVHTGCTDLSAGKAPLLERGADVGEAGFFSYCEGLRQL